MTYDHDGKVRMDCSSEYAMADVIKQIGNYDLAVGNDPDYDRYGIVSAEGLASPNAFLVAAADYLFTTRGWKEKGVGKTVVCTTMIDKWASVKEMCIRDRSCLVRCNLLGNDRGS